MLGERLIEYVGLRKDGQVVQISLLSSAAACHRTRATGGVADGAGMEIVVGSCKPSPPPGALSRASSSALPRAPTDSHLEDDSTLAAGLGVGARGGEGRRCWHPSQDGTLLAKIYSTMGVEVQVKPAQAVHREEKQHGKTKIGQLPRHGRPASEAQQMPRGPCSAAITPVGFEARSAATSADACLSVIRNHQASKVRSSEEVEESQSVSVRPSAQAAAQAEDADLMREIYSAMEARVSRGEPSRPRWANADAVRKSSDLCVNMHARRRVPQPSRADV